MVDRGKKVSVLWLVLSLLLLFVILYLIINPLNYSFVKKHYSGMIPLVEISKLNYEEVKNNEGPPAETNNEETISDSKVEQTEELQQETKPETRKDANEQPAAEIKNEDKTITQEEEPIDEKMPAENLPEGTQYYIIVASYDGPGLSGKYRDKLIKQGFDAHVIGPSHNGKYRVSIGQFPDKQRAESFMNNIRRTHTSSAWMLKK